MSSLRRRWANALSISFRSRQITAKHRERILSVLQTILLLVGIWAALIIRLSGDYGRLTLGQPSAFSIQAPLSTTFISETRTAEARAAASARSENEVFRTDPQLPAAQRGSLQQIFASLNAIRADPSLTRAEQLNQVTRLPSASLVLDLRAADALLNLSDEDWAEVQAQTLSIYDRALAQYAYAIDEKAIGQLNELSLPYWLQISGLSPIQQELALIFARAFLQVNRTLDREATAERRDAAAAAVDPVEVSLLAGESIVRIGEIVTPDKIEKLQATGAIPRPLSAYVILGRGILAAILAFCFVGYLNLFQAHIARRQRSLLVINGITLVAILGAAFVFPVIQDWVYALPLASVAMMISVVFNGRLAIAVAGVAALTIGMAAGDNFALSAALLASSAAAALLANDAERTVRFFLAGLVVIAVVAAIQIAFWLVSRVSFTWADFLRALPLIAVSSLANGAISTILALGTFNLIGRVAGVVTPLQLMEMAHPSRPLLRKLIREAPGTYYHSVAVGNLAEAAAEAIGADGLLLRVAAYYHDIGKTVRPYFFTDNQMGRENVHNDLDPATSAQIIVDHVREGVKMARSAGLPEQIIRFIASHHGTGVIRHFYQLALQQQDSVEIKDFSYPGPRPATREEGILMLADSVEATVRSKAQNGKLVASRSESNGAAGTQTLEDLVSSIIDARVREGELDDAPLTIRDLTLIKQTFITSLRSIYHPRVDYAPSLGRS